MFFPDPAGPYIYTASPIATFFRTVSNFGCSIWSFTLFSVPSGRLITCSTRRGACFAIISVIAALTCCITFAATLFSIPAKSPARAPRASTGEAAAGASIFAGAGAGAGASVSAGAGSAGAGISSGFAAGLSSGRAAGAGLLSFRSRIFASTASRMVLYSALPSSASSPNLAIISARASARFRAWSPANFKNPWRSLVVVPSFHCPK